MDGNDSDVAAFAPNNAPLLPILDGLYPALDAKLGGSAHGVSFMDAVVAGKRKRPCLPLRKRDRLKTTKSRCSGRARVQGVVLRAKARVGPERSHPAHAGSIPDKHISCVHYACAL